MSLRLLFVPALMLATAAALAACGGETAAELEAPDVLPSPQLNTGSISTEEVNFTVDVIGDVSLGMPPGEVEYRMIPEQQVGNTTVPEHYELAFWQDAEDVRYSIVLLFRPDLEPGTYDILTGTFDPVEMGVAAQVWRGKTTGPLDERERVDYNNRVEGTFTLDRVGDVISGSFEFAAEAPGSGEEDVAPPTANVAGTFTDIELTSAAPTEQATEDTGDEA